MASELVVEPPRLERASGTWRVSARVDGTDAWFESDDVPLQASSEAFASAFLIPALLRQRRLVLAAPVASDWAANVPAVIDLARRWWGVPRLLPVLSTQPVATDPQLPERFGLCFTGGVDSFFTLLQSGLPIQRLLYVQGFDVSLDDEARAAQIRVQHREISAATGIPCGAIRSNLRLHPAFAAGSWEITHGGALAAVGHVAGASLTGLLISSSTPYSNNHPWGSHFLLDHLWGGGGLIIQHVGSQYTRNEKLRLLADNQLVRRTLRVCWENRDHHLNCSRCEKCLRTRIVLAGEQKLDAFPSLESTSTLAADLDALPGIGNKALLVRYRDELRTHLPADVDAAVRRLLARSVAMHRRRRIAALRTMFSAMLRRELPRLSGWRMRHARTRDASS